MRTNGTRTWSTVSCSVSRPRMPDTPHLWRGGPWPSRHTAAGRRYSPRSWTTAPPSPWTRTGGYDPIGLFAWGVLLSLRRTGP